MPSLPQNAIIAPMKKNITCIIAAVAFACGIAIGYVTCSKLHEGQETEHTEQTVPKRKSAIRNADVNALRNRIKELERQLSERNAALQANKEPGKATQTATVTPPAQAEERRGPPTAADMRARMEEIRKNDPQRYAQMTNRFARMHSRNRARVMNQLSILGNVDMSRLSNAEREVHDQYQEAVARREELREMLNPQNEDVTEEQRRELFKEMRELDELTRKLAESERNTLLTQTVRDLGASESEANEFVETISAIYEATQVRGPGGFGRRPPRP